MDRVHTDIFGVFVQTAADNMEFFHHAERFRFFVRNANDHEKNLLGRVRRKLKLA